jgi:hypothetical protein
MRELIERLKSRRPRRIDRGVEVFAPSSDLQEAIAALEAMETLVPKWVRVEDIQANHFHLLVRCQIDDDGSRYALVADAIPDLTAEVMESKSLPCPNNCIDGVIVKFGGGEFDMHTSKCPIHHKGAMRAKADI